MSDAPSVRIAALQFDVLRDPARNLAAVERGLREAKEREVRLVLLPEMWPTSFPAGRETIPAAVEATRRSNARVAELSAELDLVVAGTAFGEPEGGEFAELPTNRLTVFERGEVRGTYDKVHLFSPTAEPEISRPGTRAPEIVETSVGRLCGVTCYDLRFPEVCRAAFHGAADLLLVPAQWPVPRAAHWDVLAAARAIENQCHVLACNRTGTERVGRKAMELEFPGNSKVIDPTGVTLAEGRGEAGLVVADVEWGAAATFRRRVPIGKDLRPALYAGWAADVGEGPGVN